MKAEPFKKFCPLINEDCIGKKCASYYYHEFIMDLMDKHIRTRLISKSKTPQRYTISEWHICGESTELTYGCSQFKHLLVQEKTTVPKDEWYTRHGRGKYVGFDAEKPIGRTEDYSDTEKQIVLGES